MRLMSVDQSLSHCAVVIWDDEGKEPETRYMIRTGSTSSKGKRKPAFEQPLYYSHNTNTHEKQRPIQ